MRRGMGAVLIIAAGALASPTIGCGGDEGSAAATSPARDTPAKKPATGRAAGGGRGRGGKTGRLDVYAQIEDRFRLSFGEHDFAADPGGDDNRDPFRSFVIRQGTGPRALHENTPIQPTDVCTEKNIRAPGHSVRDLRLIGLVLRGTRSYAQFRDPSGFGWIVRLRDCLGKEKAVVEKIGAGFVTLEVVPDMATGNQPQAERRDIQLHASELRTEEEPAGGETGEAGGETGNPPPPPSAPAQEP